MPTQEEINRVIESTDMVELVSPYVKLTKQGKKTIKDSVRFITKIRRLLSFLRKNIWPIVSDAVTVGIRLRF